jgi:hypothetical protein
VFDVEADCLSWRVPCAQRAKATMSMAAANRIPLKPDRLQFMTRAR